MVGRKPDVGWQIISSECVVESWGRCRVCGKRGILGNELCVKCWDVQLGSMGGKTPKVPKDMRAQARKTDDGGKGGRKHRAMPEDAKIREYFRAHPKSSLKEAGKALGGVTQSRVCRKIVELGIVKMWVCAEVQSGRT